MTTQPTTGAPVPAPAEAQPADFFTTAVPRQFQSGVDRLEKLIKTLTSSLDALKAVEMTVQVQIGGEGGGTWNFNLKDGAMAVSDAPAQDPIVTVVQDVTDWRRAMKTLGDRMAQMATLGAGAATGSVPPLTKAKVEKLKTLAGTIKFSITGGADGDWSILTKFGTAPMPAQPHATVTFAEDDYKKIMKGELNPQAAFMAGKARIAGDMAVVMQVGLLMMSA